MKKLVSLFVAALIFFLCSCSDFPVKEIDKNTFYLEETGKNYIICPQNLYAKTLGDKIGSTKNGTVFYKIDGAKTEEYISTGDESYRRVFAAEGTDFPVFADFGDAEIFICTLTSSGYISADTVIPQSVGASKKLQALFGGENVSLPIGNNIVDVRPIRLEAKSVKPFYYFLWLYSTSSGEYIIHDEGTGIAVNAGDLFKKYL